jgi:hypothetical protein
MARRLLLVVLACAIAFVSFGYRFLSADLTDDDYLFFAIGRQIQHFGEWPVRDLAEEGDPLHNVTSAGLQALFGYNLGGEVFFDLTMLSLAAVVAFLLARDVSGSVVAGLLTTALAVLMAPRLYDYPKAAFPMLGLLCCVGYIRRPSALRAAVLGLVTGIAFLFRHDLGVYLGAASLVTWMAIKLSGGVQPRFSVRAYAAAAAVCVLPYLVFVEFNGGLLAYVSGSQRFVEREVSRSDDPRPAFAFDLSRPLWERSPGFPVKIRWAPTADDRVRAEVERRYQLTAGVQDEGRTWRYMLRDLRQQNVRAILFDPQIEDTANLDRTDREVVADSLVERLRSSLRAPPSVAIAPGVLSKNNGITWLYYLMMALPYLVLGSLLLSVVRRQPVPESWIRIAPVVALSALAGPFWLRGNMYQNSRLADLAFPSAVLSAWLFVVAMRRARRLPARVGVAAVAVAAYVTTAGSVAAFGQMRRAVDDVLVVLDRDMLSAEIDRRTAWLLESPPPIASLTKETGMRGAVEYLQTCTTPNDRVFVYGFYPEVLYFSGRASAADRMVVLRAFWARETEQRRTIAAMQKGPMPVALIDVETAGSASAERFLDPSLSILDSYLAQRYVEVGTTGFGASTNAAFRVLVDRQRTPTGTYAPLSLPCFTAPGT